VGWGRSRPRRLREHEGAKMLRIPRQHCQQCHKTRSNYPADVVPYFRYARTVITTALGRRSQGWSWERCAEACTSDGLVATSEELAEAEAVVRGIWDRAGTEPGT
jgi:hypothetical protein